MIHALITVAIPLDAARTGSVKNHLEQNFRNPPSKPVRAALDRTGIVHFMSINVVDCVNSDGKPLPQLLFELSVDGTAAAALEQVAAAIGDELIDLLSEAGVPLTKEELVPFLARHQLEIGQGWSRGTSTGLNHDGSPATTVSRIKSEAMLATSIATLLDARSLDASALATLERVRNRLWARHSKKWAFVAEPAPFLAGEPANCTRALPRIAGSAMTTLLWPFALFAAVLAWLPALCGLAAPILPWDWRPALCGGLLTLTLGWTIALLLAAGAGLGVSAYLQRRQMIKARVVLASLLFVGAHVLAAIALGLWYFAGPGPLVVWLLAADLLLALVASGVVLRRSTSSLVRWSILAAWLILLGLVSGHATARWVAGLVVVGPLLLVSVLLSLGLLLAAVKTGELKAWSGAIVSTGFTVVLGLITYYEGLAAAAWFVIALADVVVVAAVLYQLGRRVILETLFWVVLATSVIALAFSAVVNVLPAIAVIMMAVIVIGGVGGAVGAYYLLRRRERADRPDNEAPSAQHMAEILERESQLDVQNHLFVVTPVKPGRLRKFTLRVGLWIIGAVATYCGRPGFLNGIGSIHFARWVLPPKTDTLVFLSNYDGAWESYLEDFIQKAHRGLTGVWSNAAGFPRASNLFFGGAYDGDRFKHFARSKQQPTLFWYSAYPHLTLGRIRTNAAIRQGLSRVSTEAEAADWLACFGAAPLPPTTLETAEIPTLVFGGLSPLRHATCLVLQLSEKGAVGWLDAIADDITHGEALPKDSALVVAFSRTGLEKLGLADITSFPVAFQHGMTAPGRARALGDFGPNAPKQFFWGNEERPADAVMFLYARDDATLAKCRAARRKKLSEFGQVVAYEIPLNPLPPKGEPVREAFGFVDGVSQPIVRGTRRWTLAEDRYHVIEPGEIILGYPDNRGYLPPSPAVPAEKDPANVLPAVRPAPVMDHGTGEVSAAFSRVTGGGLLDASPGQPSGPLRQRPNFHPVLSSGLRDLGRNGTFLVVRQIEQDVTAFNQFLDREASRLKGDPRTAEIGRVPLREWIAAKMVGRWKDGSSLVRRSYPLIPPTDGVSPVSGCPAAPAGRPDSDLLVGPEDAVSGIPDRAAGRPDNDFLFGPEDTAGLRCPFGSHIRRANPRDSFAPGSREQLAITNRHRILRVGRNYEERPDDRQSKRGLLFMCLNADIERQFEFVQQTWLFSPSFNGLENEIDPLMAPQCGLDGTPLKDGKFTIPTPGGPLRLSGFSRFMTVRGGGYFFMPGRKAIQFLARRAPGSPQASEPERTLEPAGDYDDRVA